MFNFKHNINIQRHYLFSGVLFMMLNFFLVNCVSNEEQPGEPSAIKPPRLLLPKKDVIPIFTPVNLSTQSAVINFAFDTSMTSYATLFIFEGTPPSVDSSGSYLSDISSCWGGTTNMTYHPWNNALVVLDSTVSAVYVCNPQNIFTPLSVTSKIFTGSMTTSQTYYWVVLGYDKDYILTHSSPLYQFIR